MKHKRKSSIAFCLLALAGLALMNTGCSVLQPKADLTQFYVLRARTSVAQKQASANTAGEEIRIGPGRIPGYLDVTPIAVQDGPNRVRYLDLDHWAEPLSKGLAQTLGQYLCQALNLKQVTLYPDPVTEPSYCEVRYSVSRFEGTLDDQIALDVSWQLVQQPSAKVLFSTRSVYAVPAKGPQRDPAGYVQRLSDAVGHWADDIAAAIRARAETR